MPVAALHIVDTESSAEVSGPLVIVVHGAMDRSSSFMPAADLLSDQRVRLYDRRGYGRSKQAGVPSSVQDHLEDLETLLDPPTVLVGHSFGAVLALIAAAKWPERIAAVGAYEPPLPWFPGWLPDSPGDRALARAEAGEPELAAEVFIRAVAGDERWETLPQRTRDDRAAESPALLVDLETLQAPGGAFNPADVAVPVLVGVGTDSPERIRQTVPELAKRLPRGELTEVPDVGHDIHFSDPQAFARFVRDTVAVAAI